MQPSGVSRADDNQMIGNLSSGEKRDEALSKQ